MNAETYAPLRDVAERLLDRDLAALAALKAEDQAAKAKIARLRADVLSERAAAGPTASEQLAAERFAQAADRRIAALQKARQALAEQIETARQAGERALGRRRAVDLLAEKAAEEAQRIAERRAETPPERIAGP